MDGGLVGSFTNKLKEQSFTIMLMVGMLYYQNKMFTEAKTRYESIIEERDLTIKKIYEDERVRFLNREKYLMKQRDAYVDDLISKK
jgi:hypothetical protein